MRAHVLFVAETTSFRGVACFLRWSSSFYRIYLRVGQLNSPLRNGALLRENWTDRPITKMSEKLVRWSSPKQNVSFPYANI